MEQYTITGMSCAACSARVEKAVGKVPGVTACSVSLLTNSMGVEGQVRGIRGMVERDAYCPDILFQASAVGKALDSFCKELLAQHIRTCVVDDLEAGRYESVDELVRVIQRLMK